MLVSIPYRYGITYGRFSDVKGNPVYWFQFLIGTVLHFLNRRRLKMTKRRKLFQFLIGTVLPSLRNLNAEFDALVTKCKRFNSL